jgi:hypothetical protein
VDDAQLAELIGLEDGVGDRAANVSSRGAQGILRGVSAVASTTVYINGG